MTSIRSRVVFTLVSALAAAGLVASVATYYSTLTEFSALFDGQLRHTALELVEKGMVDPAGLAIVGQSPEQELLIQVYDSKTNRLYVSAGGRPLPIAEKTGFLDVDGSDGRPWREFVSTVGTRIIQVAQPAAVRTSLAASAAMRIVQPMLILIPFLAIAIWLVIVQALQPLDRTARDVARRSPSSLEPIPSDGLPQELKSLVDAINSLLARLGESLSAQQRFASDAAHELRTPLAAIKLQASMLERAKTPEMRAKYTARLHQGVARATRLVEQLLTIARLDPDAAQKPTAEVDLALLASAAREDLAANAESRGITLTADVSHITVAGMGDALGLMITNLADNALRYTPEGGRIEIKVGEEASRAVITVTDNGPGIAPEERKRVFERFYRALGTKVPGTGLGLAIVSRIVEMHNGTIVIEDGFPHEEGEGCGARFVVTLPLQMKQRPADKA